MDGECLDIVSEVAKSIKGHIILMVDCPSRWCNGSQITCKISHSHGSAFDLTDDTYDIFLAWPSSPGCRDPTFSAWIWLVSVNLGLSQ